MMAGFGACQEIGNEKKLPGDAIGSRFGAMRVRISHKTMFWKVRVPAEGPVWQAISEGHVWNVNLEGQVCKHC